MNQGADPGWFRIGWGMYTMYTLIGIIVHYLVCVF